MHTNPNRTEVFAAWIVALALIAAMAAHALLPKTPPRLEPGVTDAGQPRPPGVARESPSRLPDLELPLYGIGDPVRAPEERRGLAGPGRGSENLSPPGERAPPRRIGA